MSIRRIFYDFTTAPRKRLTSSVIIKQITEKGVLKETSYDLNLSQDSQLNIIKPKSYLDSVKEFLHADELYIKLNDLFEIEKLNLVKLFFQRIFQPKLIARLFNKKSPEKYKRETFLRLVII
jgi:hypothetical protein